MWQNGIVFDSRPVISDFYSIQFYFQQNLLLKIKNTIERERERIFIVFFHPFCFESTIYFQSICLPPSHSICPLSLCMYVFFTQTMESNTVCICIFPYSLRPLYGYPHRQAHNFFGLIRSLQHCCNSITISLNLYRDTDISRIFGKVHYFLEIHIELYYINMYVQMKHEIIIYFVSKN